MLNSKKVGRGRYICAPYPEGSRSLINILNNLNQYLEHTHLAPDTTVQDVRRLCQEAMEHKLAAVCIPPLFIREARRILGENGPVKLATVVGFPMGYSAIAAKSEEIRRALEEGADEIDGVLNLAALKSGLWNHVEHDIDGMARATNMRGKALKLHIDCETVSDEDLRKIAAFAAETKIKYLVAAAHSFDLPVLPASIIKFKKVAEPLGLKIKAFGKINSKAEALALVEAGADRIGSLTALSLLK